MSILKGRLDVTDQKFNNISETIIEVKACLLKHNSFRERLAIIEKGQEAIWDRIDELKSKQKEEY